MLLEQPFQQEGGERNAEATSEQQERMQQAKKTLMARTSQARLMDQEKAILNRRYCTKGNAKLGSHSVQKAMETKTERCKTRWKWKK